MLIEDTCEQTNIVKCEQANIAKQEVTKTEQQVEIILIKIKELGELNHIIRGKIDSILVKLPSCEKEGCDKACPQTKLEDMLEKITDEIQMLIEQQTSVNDRIRI